MSDTPLIDRIITLGALEQHGWVKENSAQARVAIVDESLLQALVAVAAADKTCEWRKQSPHVGGYYSACGKHLCSMQSGANCQYCGRKLIKVDAQQEQKGRGGE